MIDIKHLILLEIPEGKEVEFHEVIREVQYRDPNLNSGDIRLRIQAMLAEGELEQTPDRLLRRKR